MSGKILRDPGKQMQRLVENHLEFYSIQNIVFDSALDAISVFPFLQELDARLGLATNVT